MAPLYRVVRLCVLALLVPLSACQDASVSSPKPRDASVAPLVLVGDDALSRYFPQMQLEMQLQAQSELDLATPVPDAITGAPVTHVSLATPAENVTVSGGWNGSGSARLAIETTSDDPDDPLPSRAILRGSTITQYDRTGNVVASGEEGTIMGATSRREWFDAHPVTPPSGGGGFLASSAVAPTSSFGVLLGRLRVSDSAMAARGTAMTSVLSGGSSIARMSIRTASATSGRTTDAVYLRLRDSGSSTSTAAQWILNELRTTAASSVTGGTSAGVRTVHRTKLRRIVLQDPVLVASLSSVSSGSATSAQLLTPRFRHVILVPDDPNDPWSPPPPVPPTPPTPPTTPPGQPPAPQPNDPLPDPAPVIFQHGFGSQADRWDAMRSNLTSSLRLNDRAYTLPTKQGLELASQTLIADVRDDAGFSKALFVAHSAGGVISRRVAQLDPARVAGIITVGTPHKGALIADRGAQTSVAIAAAALSSFFVSPCLSGGILNANSDSCNIFGLFASFDAGFILGELVNDRLSEGGSDLSPSSAFMAQVNGVPEGFPRVGITHRVPSHSAFARYLGELRLARNVWNDRASEDAGIRYERVVQTAKINVIASLIQLFFNGEYSPYGSGYLMNGDCGAVYSRFGNCGGYSEPSLASLYQTTEYQLLVQRFQLALGVYLTLTTSNYFWDWGTTDRRGGDGFIAASSQAYPNVPGSSQVPFNVETDQNQTCYYSGFCVGPPLPAHGGETRNERSGDRIRQALANTFGVVPQPGQQP